MKRCRNIRNSRLELIAVNPSVGNAAQVAIEAHAPAATPRLVLRSLSQMGVDVGRSISTPVQRRSQVERSPHLHPVGKRDLTTSRILIGTIVAMVVVAHNFVARQSLREAKYYQNGISCGQGKRTAAAGEYDHL